MSSAESTAAQSITPASSSTAGVGAIEFSSTDKHLVDAFDWAKKQALAYAYEDDPVGPWYEAALPGREAFCMRDVSHQALGAHLLGLDRHNLNMMRRFAENISESKDWASFWEINKYNLPAPVDYKNDEEFWYNLPANFDILDASWRLFRWTGDRTYIDDPVLEYFYDRTVTDYVDRWDLKLDRVMDRPLQLNLSVPIVEGEYYQEARGLPSYEESSFEITASVDLLAVQGAAYKAYANMKKLQGKIDMASEYIGKSVAVSSFIDEHWWDESNARYHSAYLGNDAFINVGGRALLYWHALTEVSRIERQLDILSDGELPGIEDLSHYPEVFYSYGRHQEARDYLLHLADPSTARREYPEVSFAVVSSIVNGLMGIDARAEVNEVVTQARLTPETSAASITNVPVFSHLIHVSHLGLEQTSFSNSGASTVTWRARFSGAGEYLVVDGELVLAEHGGVGPTAYSEVSVDVAAGQTHIVRVTL